MTNGSLSVQSQVKQQTTYRSKRGYELNQRQRQEDFLTAFVNNYGLRYKSCRAVGIRYSTFQRWLKSPDFKAKFDTAQQRVNEIMEDSLIRKALNTNSSVPEIFYLKSRDPRYSQRVTLEGEEDKPIQVTYNKDTLDTITKAISNILAK